MTDEPLCRTEAEIARAVLGRGNVLEWRALAIIYKREGMPYEIDPMTGRYYWPKIKAWLDAYNLVGNITPAPPRRSWSEKWDTPTSRRRGSAFGPGSPAKQQPTG